MNRSAENDNRQATIEPVKTNQKRPVRLSYFDAMAVEGALEDLMARRALSNAEAVALEHLARQIQALHKAMTR
jgi:hypothetical protein